MRRLPLLVVLLVFVLAGGGLLPATATPVSPELGYDVAATRWVGDGTPASCTSRAVVRAVARGGVIRFRCGPAPVRIELRRTAKVVNTSDRVVIDGGGLVTFSGGGQRRILYQNTCDREQVWATAPPVFARGGRLTIVDTVFEAARCECSAARSPAGGAATARR